METPFDNVLSTSAAAALLGLSPRTLDGWRRSGEGPPFVRWVAAAWPTAAAHSTAGSIGERDDRRGSIAGREAEARARTAAASAANGGEPISFAVLGAEPVG